MGLAQPDDRSKHYAAASEKDDFDIVAPAPAPAVSTVDGQDRLAPLLELLGPGEALPSVESTDVPWAELLQQRMASASERRGGPPMAASRVLQERIHMAPTAVARPGGVLGASQSVSSFRQRESMPCSRRLSGDPSLSRSWR